MSIPYLLSYDDPKIEKAYHRYLDGDSQRTVAKKLKVPLRTLQRYCKADGWEAERQARRDSALQKAMAASSDKVAADVCAAANVTPLERMQVMLERQQRVASRVVAMICEAAESLIVEAETKPGTNARMKLSIGAQVLTITTRALEMERKAYRVPDKMELENTTPTPADRVRTLKDDELERELADAQRAEAAAAAREAKAPSVN